MINYRFITLCVSLLVWSAHAAQDPIDWVDEDQKRIGISADTIAADNLTRTAMATGNVEAVYSPMILRGESILRAEDGTISGEDIFVTTCTNAPGHTHWGASGHVVFKENDYIELKDMHLHILEYPVAWLPYMYYPFNTDYGWRVMPGFSGKWGAYLMTKYVYHLAGNEKHEEDSLWLGGSTRFDMRSKRGIALGQGLYWGLGHWGTGKFKAYYADDLDWDHYLKKVKKTYGPGAYNSYSRVRQDRYILQGEHKLNLTERDIVRMRGSYVADNEFRSQFLRQGVLSVNSDWRDDFSSVDWEHNELAYAYGVQTSGYLNSFYGGTSRLPEIYFDIAPQNVFGLPLNYESSTHIGYLSRQRAKYGANATIAYLNRPGLWATYDAVRVDTYHRITAPFRTFDDLISVVPRVGYHGTFWDQAGDMGSRFLTGEGTAKDTGSAYRNIAEAGVTFAARGTAWIDDECQHMMEPYLDVLAQKAWHSGLSGSSRPYVFDNNDASIMWEDQFAGRSRNLPYTYYGLTPGFRNAWSKLTERGNLRQFLDIDFYLAFQLNEAEHIGESSLHKLATLGDPNYGKRGGIVVPGARIRWRPSDDLSLLARAEYDSENDRIALADIGFQQSITDDFSWYGKYALRDYRVWDFSSTPDHDGFGGTSKNNNLNRAYLDQIEFGFTHKPIYFFQWSPYIRWDIREHQLDRMGLWADYLTDCLGFRLNVAYSYKFRRWDGVNHDDNLDVSFMVYLRAFGEMGSEILRHK